MTHRSKQFKQNFPAKFVVIFDLNNHKDALSTLQQEHNDKEKVTEFLPQKLLKFQRGVRLALIKQCCELKQKVGLVIMLDGFYEITPLHKQTVQTLFASSKTDGCRTTVGHQQTTLERGIGRQATASVLHIRTLF